MKATINKQVKQEVEFTLPSYMGNWDSIEAAQWTNWREIKQMPDGRIFATTITQRINSRHITWELEAEYISAEEAASTITGDYYHASTAEEYAAALKECREFMGL